MTTKKIIPLITCLAIPLLVGGISGWLTAGETNTWYQTINKPPFNPPNWIFGPVWTTLYILMGISLFMIWDSPKSAERQRAMVVFSIQLFLNFCWSLIFFKLHMLFGAVVEIIALWLMIIYMLLCFSRVKPLAAYLNIPYLLWVSFASVLSTATWWLNR